MRFRFSRAIVEASRIEMMDSTYGGGSHYLVMDTYVQYANGGSASESMMGDYNLTLEHCVQLLDTVNDYFNMYPHDIFDFRKYEQAANYQEHTGNPVILRELSAR